MADGLTRRELQPPQAPGRGLGDQFRPPAGSGLRPLGVLGRGSAAGSGGAWVGVGAGVGVAAGVAGAWGAAGWAAQPDTRSTIRPRVTVLRTAGSLPLPIRTLPGRRRFPPGRRGCAPGMRRVPLRQIRGQV